MPDTPHRTSLHVYNARCALTIEPTRNRRGDVHTVNLESAARADGAAEFAWDDKIVVQVTGSELPDVIATLLGYVDAVEFRYHGAARDKGYRVFGDAGRLVVQLFAGARERHTVTLSRGDRLRIAVLAFRQLQRNHGGLSADVLHAMLSAIYAGRPPVPTDIPSFAAAGPAVDPPAPAPDTETADGQRARDEVEPDGVEPSERTEPTPDDGAGRDAYDW